MFASRKRARDEDEDAMLELEHEHKLPRSCSLPFRTSPITKHVRTLSRSPRNKPAPIFTQTMTPPDSSEEEDSPPFSKGSRLELSSQLNINTIAQQPEHPFDVDTEMMDFQTVVPSRQWGQQASMASPQASPRTVTPPSPGFKTPIRSPHNSVFGGRLPTPIYGHFQQSIDAKMEMGEDPENIIPRSQQEVEYENYVRRRRLPTPITEDEAMAEFPTTAGGITRHVSMNNCIYNGQQPSIKTPNGFITSPRGRLSFSMGFRADCEMCRNRVPGHTNHIFRT